MDGDPIGAPHASDIEYLLGNLDLIKLFDWREEDHKASEVCFGYVANFIKGGNPNGNGLIEWPDIQDASTASKVLHLTAQPQVIDAINEGRFGLLDKIHAPGSSE